MYNCEKHAGEGLPDYVLLLKYSGQNMMELFKPQFLTNLVFDREKITYEVIHDPEHKYHMDDNFYFVFGHMARVIKSCRLAYDQVNDEYVKSILANNGDVLESITKAIISRYEVELPELIVSRMYGNPVLQ